MQKQNRVIGAVVGLSTIAGSSFAALPTEVTDALTAAKADGLAVGVAVLVAIVAIYALKLARRAL